MPSTTEITVSQLARLIGTPHVPRLLDVRTEADFAADPRLIPGAIRRDPRTAASWIEGGDAAVVYCQHGGKLSQGAAAWMRHAGTPAQTLVGGFAAWRDAGEMLVQTAALPAPDPAGRTVWVTRARPKVDRIACPWLIRRFVDPYAVFLFVAPSEVTAVGERFSATPFDIEDVFFSHRGPLCTFDAMLARSASLRSRCCISRASFAAPTRHSSTSRRGRRECWRRRSACHVCFATICNSSTPA